MAFNPRSPFSVKDLALSVTNSVLRPMIVRLAALAVIARGAERLQVMRRQAQAPDLELTLPFKGG
jgi:hypothetical protein